MFVDKATIKIKAGNGGNGAVSFHREKYVAAGGPDGGDGGRGGDVLFQADTNLSTLVDFRYKRKFLAQNGADGSGKRMTGKSGQNLVIRVPKGTLVREASTGRLLADISGDEPVKVASGGRGGWGNQHFATATRQVPRFAKPGTAGEEYEVQLELKLLADVGLVGFPNVGKSTLLSVCSAARPKIANYHFTTLSPMLGVVRVAEEESFVMADIPGLIEGASDGVGLGHEFLRHVERCRLLVHVVDVSGSEGRDPAEDFEAIMKELERFSPALASRPMVVAANKCDSATPQRIDTFRRFVEERGLPFFPISAATTEGVDALVHAVWRQVQTLPPITVYEPEPAPLPDIPEDTAFTVHRADDAAYVIDAPWLERVLTGVNMEDYESLQYFQRVLRLSGIIDRLEEMGIEEGDTVRIFDFEFDYVR